MVVLRMPYDNVVRPPRDRFSCNGREEGGGTHWFCTFFYVEEYLRLMAPGLDLVAAVASSEAFTKWCCAKHDFCDEHLLWLAVRWSGYDPRNQ